MIPDILKYFGSVRYKEKGFKCKPEKGEKGSVLLISRILFNFAFYKGIVQYLRKNK